MGTVYRARDTKTDETVALKVLGAVRTDADRSAQSLGPLTPLPEGPHATLGDHAHSDRGRRFLLEARVLAQLSHPAIVRYVAHGFTQEGLPYLAMAWLEGETLATRLARGRLDAGEAIQLGLRLAGGLSSAHGVGVVHRDIKPSNVVLVDGQLEKATLIDFGVAHTSHTAGSDEGCLLGTVGYLAPEQARGDADLDARVDVFGLGCLLYRFVTGRLPFDGEDAYAVLQNMLCGDAPRASHWAPHLPAHLVELLARMLAVDPTARPRDGAAVVDALELLLEERLAQGKRLPVLGWVERRLATVVLVGRARPAAGEAPRRALTQETGEDPPTLFDDSAASWLKSVRAAAKPFGANARPLGDLQVVLIPNQSGSVRDRMRGALELAICLRNTGGVRDVRVETMALQVGGEFHIEALSAVSPGGLKGRRLMALLDSQGAMERLSAQARRILRAASLQGMVFTKDDLRDLLGEHPAADDALGELVEAGCIDPRGQAYVFNGEAWRKAALASLTAHDLALAARLTHAPNAGALAGASRPPGGSFVAGVTAP
jgi:serine/threonine protein kinase